MGFEIILTLPMARAFRSIFYVIISRRRAIGTVLRLSSVVVCRL